MISRRKFLGIFGLSAIAAVAAPALLLKEKPPVPRWRRVGDKLHIKGTWQDSTIQHFSHGTSVYTVPKGGYYRVSMIGGGGPGGQGRIEVVKFYANGEQVELPPKGFIHRL